MHICLIAIYATSQKSKSVSFGIQKPFFNVVFDKEDSIVQKLYLSLQKTILEDACGFFTFITITHLSNAPLLGIFLQEFVEIISIYIHIQI